jgi:hypothetical protein
MNKKEFLKLKQIKPNKVDQIVDLSRDVRIKINPLSLCR